MLFLSDPGVDEGNNSTLPISEALKDDTRVNYHYKHLLFLNLAIKCVLLIWTMHLKSYGSDMYAKYRIISNNCVQS